MNKIKVLYDVVKTIRNQEVIEGILTAGIQKDQVSIFTIKNEFAKNLLTGQTKAKINTQLDYEGKTVKHESATEFTLPFGRGHFHGGMPAGHHHHHDGRCGGLRGGFSRLAFALGLLNALELQVQDDKTMVLSLEAANLPADVKELVRERMSHAGAHHPRHGFMKEFASLAQLDFKVLVFISPGCNIERILVTFAGIQQDEQGEHEVKSDAEVVLQTKENK